MRSIACGHAERICGYRAVRIEIWTSGIRTNAIGGPALSCWSPMATRHSKADARNRSAGTEFKASFRVGQQIPGLGVEGAEHAVVGAADEDEVATGSQRGGHQLPA